MTANVLRILGMIATPVSQRIGVAALRISIAIVFLWIGALKFVPYEADSITPLVANSPVMSFFYKHPEDYKAHPTREGELKPADRAWETANNTYAFSYGLGTVELIIGFLVLSGLVSVRLGLAGAVLGVPYTIRHPLLPRDDAGSLGVGPRRCTTRLPLSLRCWPPCAQRHCHSGRRMASCRRRCARKTSPADRPGQPPLRDLQPTSEVTPAGLAPVRASFRRARDAGARPGAGRCWPPPHARHASVYAHVTGVLRRSASCIPTADGRHRLGAQLKIPCVEAQPPSIAPLQETASRDRNGLASLERRPPITVSSSRSPCRRLVYSWPRGSATN